MDNAASCSMKADARDSHSTRVVVVEDDPNMRETLKCFLNRISGYRCIGDLRDGETAVKEIPGLKPDLVLMDIGLPGMSGVECVAKLKTLMPALPIIMLTVYDEGDFLFEALKAGANGYLLKRTIGDKLVEAMQEVRTGGLPLSRSMAERVTNYFQEIGKTEKGSKDEFNKLRPREREVLKLLANGYRYKEIAVELDIGVDTVREYLRRIYAAFHVSSRTEAVVKYLGGTVTNKSGKP